MAVLEAQPLHSERMHRVLVVDDSLAVRTHVQAALVKLRDVVGSVAAFEPLRAMPLGGMAPKMSATNLPDSHGFELLHFIRTHAPDRAVARLTTSPHANALEPDCVVRIRAKAGQPMLFTEQALRGAVQAVLSCAAISVREHTAATDAMPR